MEVPIVPMGFDKARKSSAFLSYWARQFIRSFPKVQVNLSHVEEDVSIVEYVSVALFSAGFYCFVAFFMVMVMGRFSPAPLMTILLVSIVSAVVAYVFVFIYIINYPKLMIERKMRSFDRDLPYALRHLLVQVSSGVSLYDSIASIADGDYGSISTEFTKVITETQGGMEFITALEDSALKNPYPNYRNAVWQISNASKGGADISGVIRDIVTATAEQQKIDIKAYGSNLNFLSLIYMVLTIALPTIGVVFLMIVSTFLGMAVPPTIFLLLIIFLIIMQYVFMGIIQAKRPVVIV